MPRRLGKKGKRYTAPIPWDLAVEIAGTKARLTAGVPRDTWAWWRRSDAVPAYHVLPFLLEHYMTTRRPVLRVVRPGEGASRPTRRERRA